MRIRSILRGLAVVIMILAAIAAVINLLDLTHYATAFAMSIGTIVLAGILWMLTEISEQIAELPEDLRDRHSISTPSAADSVSALRSPQPPRA